MKNLTTAQNNFQNSLKVLRDENVLTLEDLRRSKHSSDYWVSAYDLAEAIVHTNGAKVNGVGSYNGFERDDWKSELGLTLVERYSKLSNTFSTPRIDDNGEETSHNYLAYGYSILSSKLSKEIKPYITKEHKVYIDENGKTHRRLFIVEEIDMNGNITKVKYKIVSGNTPCDSNDEDSCCLLDLIESNIKTDANMDRSEEERISSENLWKYARHLAKLKSKGPFFVFIQDTFRHNDLNYGLPYLQMRLRNADLQSSDSLKSAVNAIVNVYNHDLLFFMRFIGVSDIDFVKKNLAKDVNEFRKNYAPKNEADFNKHVSRFRYIYKKELAKLLGIELPHQERARKTS